MLIRCSVVLPLFFLQCKTLTSRGSLRLEDSYGLINIRATQLSYVTGVVDTSVVFR